MNHTARIDPPEGKRETNRYADYFRRMGLTQATILESVELTFRRSNVYFDDLYAWMSETNTFKSACRKGCGFCCHTQVSALPPEVFYLADQIESLDAELARDLKQRVIEHDRLHRGKTGEERYTAHVACPLLDPETWGCTIHSARPLTCRSMHSSDVKACQKAYETRDAYVPAPSHQLFFQNATAYHQAFASVLSELGLHMYPLELNAALTTIWTQEDSFNRWLKGEDVFADACTTKVTS